MLFMGKAISFTELEVLVEIGEPGVGSFWLGRYGEAKINFVAEQGQEPLRSTARLKVPWEMVAETGWGGQGFVIRVSATSPDKGMKLPVSLSVMQDGNALAAIDPHSKPMNGTAPPYTPIVLEAPSDGAPLDVSFGWYFG